MHDLLWSTRNANKNGVPGTAPTRTIYVGDPYQQIYEWRGAINAMDRVETANRALLSQSFRFGDRIAVAASRVLGHLGATNPIKGYAEIDSHVADVHPVAILSRTNAGVMTNLFNMQAEGARVDIAGGWIELKRLLEHVSRLKQGLQSDLPDFLALSIGMTLYRSAKKSTASIFVRSLSL